MPWQIYLTVSVLLISCNGLFHRALLKDDGSSPQTQTLAFLGLGGVFALLITLFQNKLNLAFPPALYLAYQTGRNAAMIGPLRSTHIIVTVILAILILKERNNILNKLVGSLVAAGGVALLL